MGKAVVRGLAANWLPLALSAAAIALVAMLFRTDRDLELYKFPSHRYRMHAIPVAISQVYHGRAHDYTSQRNMAFHFQNTEADLDELIQQMIKSPPPDDGKPYYWTADDRGLSDYVNAAFRLYGPRTKSLTKFFFLLFGATLVLYFVGYWRTPVVLAAPVLALCGLVALAQVLSLHTKIPFSNGVWQEHISLYESRLFEVLGLVAVLHLAVLAAGGARVSRAAWLTAVPQAALLVFLLHCRSTLGWQYLALFLTIGVRVGLGVWRKVRGTDPAALAGLGRPLFVGVLLGASLVGLKQYKKAKYNPEYFRESGSRTFWHNAIMGFSFSPKLEKDLDLPGVDDNVVAELIIKWMKGRNDPRLTPEWTRQTAMNSLGSHNSFDWPAYEAACREYYFETWRTKPGKVAECYAWYKPRNVVKQVNILGKVIRREAEGSRTNVLAGTAALLAFTLAVVFAVGRRDDEVRGRVRVLSRIGVLITLCSLIPGMAFYAATTTLACFYVSLPVTVGLFAVRAGWRLTRRPAAAPIPATEPAPTKLAA